MLAAASWHGQDHRQRAVPWNAGQALLQGNVGTAGDPLTLPGTHTAAAHGTGNTRLWTQPGMSHPAPGMDTDPKRGTEAQPGVSQTHLFGCHVRKVPQGPQAVLDQPGAGAGQVLAQCLHATCREGDNPVSTPGHPSRRSSEQQQGCMGSASSNAPAHTAASWLSRGQMWCVKSSQTARMDPAHTQCQEHA